MGKTILFSPVGGNDPISSVTERDGSMLHICRVYKPDSVYLYLSKEMLERQKEDNRYLYCLDKLGEMTGHSFDVHCIERGDLTEVQEYNYYFEDFKKIIEGISVGREDVLLVNVASGTPAMKSALLVLATLAEYKFLPIQVSTPEKAINRHSGKDKDYDVEYYWELNKDNEPDFENRCCVAKCPNLVAILKKNIIEKHIRAYDYPAALRLAEEIKEDITDDAYTMLQFAVARIQLDFSNMTILSKRAGVDFLPVKDSSQAIIFEYALTLQVKMLRKEYGDFVRAISPLITDLFEMILKNYCKIKVKDYCVCDNKGIYRLDRNTMEKTQKGKEIMQILDAEFKKGIKDLVPVSASNLKPLLVYYLKDAALIKNVETLRDIESTVRNMAAHEIVSITDEKLTKLMGRKITIDQIMNLIKKMVAAANIKIKKEDWDSYDRMNDVIVCELEKMNL